MTRLLPLALMLVCGVLVLLSLPGMAAPIEVLTRAANGEPLLGRWCHGGRPPEVVPPPNPIVSPAQAGGRRILSGVPAWTWCYGCSNTAAAIIMGYYDRGRYPNMYTGPAAGTPPEVSSAAASGIPGLCPLYNESVWPDNLPNPIDGESPLAASHKGYDGRTTRAHVDDWWNGYGNMFDPCLDSAPPWTPHTPDDCLGDFMWTSRADKGCPDGFTNFAINLTGQPMHDYKAKEPLERDGMHGVKLFVESRGYSVNQVYTQIIWPAPSGFSNYTGFKFEDFCNEIAAGRPVMILCTNHTFVGYGYDKASEKIYIRTTWDNDPGNSHTVKWGEQYGGETMMVVGVLRLNAPPADPQPDLALSTVPGAWAGENEFGGDQSAERKIMPGGTEEFALKVTNRGNVTDTFTLKAPTTLPGWQVTYYTGGGDNITGEITGAGWTTPSIPPWGSVEVRIVVEALPGLAANALLALSITSTSATMPTRTDAVQAITTRVTSDLSGDGHVNSHDAQLFIKAWRAWVQSLLCDPDADMNASGSVGVEDARRFVDLFSSGQ